jgi:hypothetical protein
VCRRQRAAPYRSEHQQGAVAVERTAHAIVLGERAIERGHGGVGSVYMEASGPRPWAAVASAGQSPPHRFLDPS